MKKALSLLFSRDAYIKYSVLSDALKFTNNREFDILYANFETFHHWEPELRRLIKQFDETGEMSDAEFIFTAQAIRNILDKIDDFVKIINGTEFPYNFENVIRNGVRFTKPSITNEIDREKNEIFDEEDPIHLYKELGMYRPKKDDDAQIRDKNKWRRVIIRLRDKLCHPNSDVYQTIHIMGNASGFGDDISKKTFDFKGSFASNVRFNVQKDIFLRAYETLEDSFFNVYKIWNQEINTIVISKATNSLPKTETIEGAFLKFKFDDEPVSKMLRKYSSEARLFKVGQFEKNNDIKKFAVVLYKLNYIFKQYYNYEFWRSGYGDFSLHEERYEIIKKYHPGSRSSPGYASEKIGHWEDWDAKEWFPTIFEYVDLAAPGQDPYELRIFAIGSRKLKWDLMLENAERYLEYITTLCPEQVQHMTGEEIEKYRNIKIYK